MGMFGGDVRFVVAGSGHIAGVINPVTKPKYQYWTGGALRGTYEDWLKAAKEHPGSWWPDWAEWIAAQGPKRCPRANPAAMRLCRSATHLARMCARRAETPRRMSRHGAVR